MPLIEYDLIKKFNNSKRNDTQCQGYFLGNQQVLSSELSRNKPNDSFGSWFFKMNKLDNQHSRNGFLEVAK